LLFESMIEKGFTESGATAKFLQEAFEFGRIQAELGARIPIIHTALGSITTRLRMLFLMNTFVAFSIRDTTVYAPVTGQDRDDAIREMHRILYRAAQLPDKEDFGAACKLVEEFSRAASVVSDETLLRVMRAKSSALQRFRDFLRRRAESRAEAKSRRETLRKLSQTCSSEFPALGIAAEDILRKMADARVSEQKLKRSAESTIQAFHQTETTAALAQACEEFLEKMARESDDDSESLGKLLQFKIDGVSDPDIDLFLGASTGGTELVERALARGGNPHVRIGEVLKRHQPSSQ